MEIKTEFNCRTQVYALVNNKIIKCVITGINIGVVNREIEIKYLIHSAAMCMNSEVFENLIAETPEKLTEKLINNMRV